MSSRAPARRSGEGFGPSHRPRGPISNTAAATGTSTHNPVVPATRAVARRARRRRERRQRNGLTSRMYFMRSIAVFARAPGGGRGAREADATKVVLQENGTSDQRSEEVWI